MAGYQQLVDLQFTLRGVSDLLMNNPATALQPDATGVTAGKKVIDAPDVAAEKRAYRDGQGQLVVPASAVYCALVDGSSTYRVGGRSMKTIVAGALYMLENWFALTDDAGAALAGYEIDQRRVVNNMRGSSGGGGGAVVRARPLVHAPWFLQCHFMLDAALIQEKYSLMRDVADTAGARIGIGDYRPQKMGWFGRFQVASFRIDGKEMA